MSADHECEAAIVASSVRRYLEVSLSAAGPPAPSGPGEDFPARDAPDDDKRALEERYCGRAVREPSINALAVRSRRGV